MIPDINLMPKLEKSESSSKRMFLLIGILTVLTLLILSWLYFSAKSELDSFTSDRDALQLELEGLNVEGASYEISNQGSLEESVAFVERVSYAVTPIVDETKGLLPQNTYLRSYVFSENALQVQVDFETLNSISSYVSSLEKSLFFDDVQVGVISNFELDPNGQNVSDRVSFDEIPRYSVEFNLIYNQAYVATGGEH
jgi:hypothetical protein